MTPFTPDREQLIEDAWKHYKPGTKRTKPVSEVVPEASSTYMSGYREGVRVTEERLRGLPLVWGVVGLGVGLLVGFLKG